MARMSWAGSWGRLAVALAVLGAVLATPGRSYAEHGDYVLGTLGLLGAVQPPEGIYYQNIFSYYTANGEGNFEVPGSPTAPTRQQQLALRGSLSVFYDQNLLGVTTPFTILGARYGAMIDIRFNQVHGSGNASLDLRTLPFDTTEQSFSRSTSSTASFNIADLYVEPMNFGWHLPQLDVLATFGFFAPSGRYDSREAINNGLGRWAEMFGLGGVVYFNSARSWSLSAMPRYLIHQSQQGLDVRVGDDVILEWGVGKTFRPASWTPWVRQLDAGVAGYGQWQVTNTTGSAWPSALHGVRSNILAVGPEIAVTASFARFFARWEIEYGIQNFPVGQAFLVGATVAFDPFK